jgi:transposase
LIVAKAPVCGGGVESSPHGGLRVPPYARLTLHGRRLLVERVHAGRPVAHVATEMGISRPTAHKWVRRWRLEGDWVLADRPSRPRTTPHRTRAEVEARVCRLRQDRKLGPARLGPTLGLPASTVHRILTRHGLNRLAFLEQGCGSIHSASGLWCSAHETLCSDNGPARTVLPAHIMDSIETASAAQPLKTVPQWPRS